MSELKKIIIGQVGFGTVGSGVVRVLTENKDIISARLGAEIVLKRIVTKELDNIPVPVPEGTIITDDYNDILNDEEIEIVIELIGGQTVAKDLVMGAFSKGKHVVTANKALISACGKEIMHEASVKGLDIGYEASVGGGIPVLKSLKDGLVANRIDSMYGIINGTGNYILTSMEKDGRSFEEVLKEAQELGYAEADPSFDVDGIDTAHKLAILIALAYGTYVKLDDIYCEGIREITDVDVNFAKEFGYNIKLLAISKYLEGGKVEARVHPTMVPKDHPLASVDGAFNSVFITGNAVTDTMFYGPGAGQMPTASAVVADVVDISRDILKGSTGRVKPLSYFDDKVGEVEILPIEEVSFHYYLRFTVVDEPGVLGSLSGILGKYNISISSVIQRAENNNDDDGKSDEDVSLVMFTHEAKEKDLRAALKEIEATNKLSGKTVFIRVESSL